MSQDEQNAAIGALVKGYVEAKQRRVAVLALLGRMADVLARFSDSLRSAAQPTGFRLRVPGEYPSPEQMTALLDELTATEARINRDQALLRQAGLHLD